MDRIREKLVKEIASGIVHLYYGTEHDAEELIPCLAPEFNWTVSGEKTRAMPREKAAACFKKAAVPWCAVEEESCSVMETAPEVYVCVCGVLVSASVRAEFSVQQRQCLTLVLHMEDGELLCTHIHASTPDQKPSEGGLSYEAIKKNAELLEYEGLQQKHQLEVILSTIPGALIACLDDEDFTYIDISAEAAGMFGYTVEELLTITGGAAGNLIYPLDRERAMRECHDGMANGVYMSKYRVQCKDGSLKWVLNSGKKFYLDDGRAFLHGMYMDVTETEELNQQLLEQGELLENVYNTIPFGVLRFVRRNGSFRVVTLNKAALQLLDCDDMAQFNSRWDERIGIAGSVIANDRHVIRESYGRLQKVGDRGDIEYRAQWRDGTVHWLKGFNMVVGIEKDGSMVIQRMMEDVTELKTLSRQVTVEQENRRKEQKIRQAMEQAYEAANRANHAKSEFLSRMSHDIRTPMNAIMGMTSIARRTIDDKTSVANCLEKIAQSSNHLLDLINEVLDMSKIESRDFTISETPFSIVEMVKETADMVRPSMDGKNHHFQVEIGEIRHQNVIGDPIRVQEILMNFLSNAVKYTGDGGDILLSAEELPQTPGGGACFRFVIQDNGIGMTQEFQEKMFLPFERAEDSRVSKIQGTGLGMSIAKNLVQMMNGSIQVESALNEGSRFTVTLFFKAAEQQDVPSEIVPETGDEDGCFLENTPTILLVEDNELNREIARTMLEMAGALVEEAEDGKDGVEKFQNSPLGHYQAILMDIQMPVMNGNESARAIRELDRSDAGVVPIIALTANAFSEDVRKSLDAGMNAHLSKPLDQDVLIRTLKHWIR